VTAADLLMAAGMHGRQASFLALAVLAMALPAQAAEALHFTARTVHVHPADDDNEIRVSFPFSCVAAVPVTILSSRTSCGCTLATLSELVNAPGQQGSVDAVVDVGNVSGAVTRTITLITNHHDDRTIVLTIAADLPPVPSFTPSFLSWHAPSA
jgi:hypothetical protein